MVSRRKSDEPMRPRRPPATTPEARENQMIALAVELAEKQIREGTASSQVVTHYLKLGTTRERLEQEKIRHETALLRKKEESLESQARMEIMYQEALNAMRSYSGQAPIPTGNDMDDDYVD